MLASQSATPGGGSAAAIIGAMGAALVAMVCNLTIGKKKYAEVEGEMSDLLAKSEALRDKLTGMIEDDVKAFDAVMGAYGMPKETDAEKAKRERRHPGGAQARDRRADAPAATPRARLSTSPPSLRTRAISGRHLRRRRRRARRLMLHCEVRR